MGRTLITSLWPQSTPRGTQARLAQRGKRHSVCASAMLAIDVDLLFSAKLIAKLARDGKLPPDADLAWFGYSVRFAAEMYLQEAGAASGAKVRVDVLAIQRTVKPINRQDKARCPDPIITALDKASPETLRMLNRRAEVRGVVFPTTEDILDPNRIESAAQVLDAITRVGGCVRQGRKRPSGRQSKQYDVELYAPISPKNFAKREAERAAIKRLRAAWRWAAAGGDFDTEKRMPANTPAMSASRQNSGPFVGLASGFFAALGVKVDVVNLINSAELRRPGQLSE
jgi:hypothetical protein